MQVNIVIAVVAHKCRITSLLKKRHEHIHEEVISNSWKQKGYVVSYMNKLVVIRKSVSYI
jgi:hypothetical protein